MTDSIDTMSGVNHLSLHIEEHDRNLKRLGFSHPCQTDLFLEFFDSHVVDSGEISERLMSMLITQLRSIYGPQDKSHLYAHYLLNDHCLKVNYNGKSYLLSDFLLQFEQYRPMIQRMANMYNQAFLEHQETPRQPSGLLMNIPDPLLKQMYQFDSELRIRSGENHGINLKFPCDHSIPAESLGYTIDLGVRCQSISNRGYFLMPRSSIGKTPLRLANSIGLIESTYRGSLMVKVDNHSKQPYEIKKGDSLFQLVLPSVANQWSLQWVECLSQTERGTGGFGSTGL